MKIGNSVMFKFLVVVLCTSLVPLMGVTYANGAVELNGVPDDAIHIQTAVQLAGIGGEDSADKYYVLDNDIDIVDGWLAIDDFRGTFDGQGYSINNLYMLENSNSMFAGLFGLINVDGVTIKNVGVNMNSDGSNANFNFSYVGGLVGYIHGDATILNCYVTGDIITDSSYGSANAGGLIGCSNGDVTIMNCYVTGDITAVGAGSCAGGLIGSSGEVATIVNCYVTGNVTAISTATYRDASAYAGGLIGSSGDFVNLSNCYTTGDITTSVATDNAYAGGLIGRNSGNKVVDSCYRLAAQKIRGAIINDVGTPLLSASMKKQQSFIGWDFDTIWAIDSNTNNGYPHLRSSITSLEIDSNTNNAHTRLRDFITKSNVVHIQTAEELADIGGAKSADKHYVLDNDINLVGEWVPIYDFRGTFDGQGHSINNLYVLKSSKREQAGLFGQTSNVTIKNVGVNISSRGLTASGSAGGLIGQGGKVSIMNCYVVGDVTTNGDSVGGLIGWNWGASIKNCYVVGDVSAISTSYAGRVFAGGLIGYGSGGITVANSYVTGDIIATSSGYGSGNDYVCAGGFVGYSGYGGVAVENSYTTGDITATSTGTLPVYVGGLVGYSWIGEIAIKNSYTTGDISASGSFGTFAGGLASYSDSGIVTESCYHLSSQKISGDTINDAGKPLSYEEMHDQQSFVDWDFKTLWTIVPNTNEGYPYLLFTESEFISTQDLFGSFWVNVLLIAIVLIVVGAVFVVLKKRFAIKVNKT